MDYKKKYEEALERAKVINPGTADYEVAVKIFPELKSEDEMVVKAIIKLVKDTSKSYTINALGVDQKDMIDYLEKQGEQKPANNHFTPEQADVLDKHIDEFIKQKPIDKIKSKFKVGDIIRHKDSLAEYVIESISGGYYHGKGWGLSIDCDEDYELVGQKPAWSEEDKNCEKNLRIYYGRKEYE